MPVIEGHERWLERMGVKERQRMEGKREWEARLTRSEKLLAEISPEKLIIQSILPPHA